MENSLKQRLVGAITLLALAVIFLPAILDEKKDQVPLESQIPTQPTSHQRKEIQLFAEEIINDSPDLARTGVSGTSNTTAVDTSVMVSVEEAGAKRKSAKGDEKEANRESNTADQAVSEEDQSAEMNAAKTSPESISKSAPTPRSPPARTTAALSDTASGQAEQKATAKDIGPGFEKGAWIIQVGSFSNEENAQKLVSTLKQAGYKAFARSRTVADKKTVMRVLVGPELQRQTAESQLPNLQKLSGLKPMVMVFDPTNH